MAEGVCSTDHSDRLYWIRMAVHVTLLVLLLLALRFVASLLSLA